jgi:hypothetical protein
MEAGAKAEAEANNREKTAADFMVYVVSNDDGGIVLLLKIKETKRDAFGANKGYTQRDVVRTPLASPHPLDREMARFNQLGGQRHIQASLGYNGITNDETSGTRLRDFPQFRSCLHQSRIQRLTDNY